MVKFDGAANGSAGGHDRLQRRLHAVFRFRVESAMDQLEQPAQMVVEITALLGGCGEWDGFQIAQRFETSRSRYASSFTGRMPRSPPCDSAYRMNSSR